MCCESGAASHTMKLASVQLAKALGPLGVLKATQPLPQVRAVEEPRRLDARLTG